jgi:hypothetical protein
LITLTCVSLILTSCGGGTIGTGITSLGRNARSAEALTFSASLTVIDARGKPCPGAEISIAAKAQIFSAKADTAGTVTLPLTIYSGEMLGFSVRCGTRAYRAHDYLSPAGAAAITRSVKLLANGSLEIAEP